MPLHRAMRAVSRGFPVIVLWIYIGALVLGLAMMFVFPLATIFLVAAGLVGLAVLIPLARLLRALERRSARAALECGACPACGEAVSGPPDDATPWRCEACGGRFDAAGAELAGAAETGAAQGA